MMGYCWLPSPLLIFASLNFQQFWHILKCSSLAPWSCPLCQENAMQTCSGLWGLGPWGNNKQSNGGLGKRWIKPKSWGFQHGDTSKRDHQVTVLQYCFSNITLYTGNFSNIFRVFKTEGPPTILHSKWPSLDGCGVPRFLRTRYVQWHGPSTPQYH